MISNATHNKEVLYRRDSSQVGGLMVLPTLKLGGRGAVCESRLGKIS
jgi:hypothetical protein